MSFALSRWLWAAQLRAQPGRLLVATFSIAIGVALALSIHLVNRSALAEFDAALAVINGHAQARIEARTGSFDEALYPKIANAAAVSAASPVIEVSVPARVSSANPGNSASGGNSPIGGSIGGSPIGEWPRLRVIGIDPMRAAAITPDLLPSVAQSGSSPGAATDLFADDAIFLSPRALEVLRAKVGDTLQLRSGPVTAALRIAGTADRVAGGVALAVMDIGTLQWRLGWLGRLTRIDLRLAPGVSVADLHNPATLALPADVVVVQPQAAHERMSNLSRAYRVNLTVLALVALFTGGFIVHSAMTLTVTRQQGELALLGVLGASRSFVLRQTLGFAMLPGIAGSLLGLGAGILGAKLLLELVGGDLGGGYFAGSAPSLAINVASLAGFGAAGLATALVGGLTPAWRIAGRPAARALRSGASEELLASRTPLALPLALLVLGAALVAAPPIAELPLPAYVAIGLWLIAGIALVTAGIRLAAPALRSDTIARIGPSVWLAAQRVASTPGGSGAALGGIVASVALASSMAIMVTSFRSAVDIWLDVILPADLYAHIDSAGPQAGLDEATQDRIAALPGISRVEFQHVSQVTLDPQRPPVTLLARPIDSARPGQRLPIIGAVLAAPADAIPVWVSEAMVDLYGWRPGSRVSLPIGESSMASSSGSAAAPRQRFFVAAVWRDYARQHGAIVIDLAAWRRLTDDLRVTDAALWLAPGEAIEKVAVQVRQSAPDPGELIVRSVGSLREISLKIFDRSFAVTWALEAVAIIVALLGVASAWSAEAIARRREFGMLRHLGMTPGAIVLQFAFEAATLVAAALVWGLALGAAIALVLVHRVNPQSFHWTMDVIWPVSALTGGALALIVLAVAVAVFAARQASSVAPVQAVKEDW